MRTLRLARVVAEAEALRWRRIVRRTAIRLVLGGIAALFLLAALAVGHFVVYLAIAAALTPVHSALIVLGIDLAVATLFGMFAAFGGSDRIEREARAVRDQARGELLQIASTATILAPLVRQLGKRGVVGVVLATLATRLFQRKR
jgi:hypothetical protein